MSRVDGGETGPPSAGLWLPRDARTWVLTGLVYLVLGGLWSLALGAPVDPVAHPDAPLVRAQELGLFPLAGGVMASLSGAWRGGWLAWLVRWIWATVYAAIFLLLFLAGGVGVLLPRADPTRVFGHGWLTGLLWVAAGVPLGLLAMAVGGIAWARAGTPDGGLVRAALRVRKHPLTWMARSAAALAAIAGLAWLVNRLDAQIGPLSDLVSEVEFAWVAVVWSALAGGGGEEPLGDREPAGRTAQDGF